MIFHLFEFDKPFLFNHWFFYIDWVLNWHLIGDVYSYWDLHNLLCLYWWHIDRSIDVNWLLYNGWNLHCYGFNNLSWNLFYYLNGNFFLNLDIFRNLNYLLNDSLRPLDNFRYLNNNFNRFFYNNFFDNFFWSSQVKSLYLFLTFFD